MLTSILIASLSGLVIGGVSTAVILKNKEPESPTVSVPVETVASIQQDVIKQLTDIDLLEIPCSAEYMEKSGDLLCREMFCRMTTRGIDAKTSGQECEEISNVSNSKTMIDHCEKFLESSEQCYEKYRERK